MVIPISCRSGAGQGKFTGQRPAFYQWVTTLTVWMADWLLTQFFFWTRIPRTHKRLNLKLCTGLCDSCTWYDVIYENYKDVINTPWSNAEDPTENLSPCMLMLTVTHPTSFRPISHRVVYRPETKRSLRAMSCRVVGRRGCCLACVGRRCEIDISPVSTTRVDGPSWRVTGLHYPSTRAVLTSNKNRSLVNSGRQLG